MNPVHAAVNLALARAIESMSDAARAHIAANGIADCDPKYIDNHLTDFRSRPNRAAVAIRTNDRATRNALRKQGFAGVGTSMANEALMLYTLAGVVGRRIIPADVSIYRAMSEAWRECFPPGCAFALCCPPNYADLYALRLAEQESAKHAYALLQARDAAAVEGLGLDAQQTRHFLGLLEDWSAVTHMMVRRWAKGRPRASIPLPPWADGAIAGNALSVSAKLTFAGLPPRRHLVLTIDGKFYVLLPRKRWSPPKDREALAALVKRAHQ
jgi:hypothetical protein